MSKRFWVFLVVLGLLIAGTALPASAHAIYVSSNPATNEILETPPTYIEVAFSEPIVPDFSRILVLSQAGTKVEVGAVELVDNAGTIARVPVLEEMGTGSYLVSWQVLSTVDGHTTSGTLAFGIGISELAPTSQATTSDATKPTLASAGGRLLNLVALSLLLGVFAFRLFVWNPIVQVDGATKAEQAVDNEFGVWGLRIGWLAVGLGLASLLFTFVSQQARLGLTFDTLGVWFGTHFGLMWTARLVILLAIAGILRFIRDWKGILWWIGLLFTLLLTGATALVSHSAALSQDVWLATGIDFLHAVSAGLWVGGLVQFVMGLWLARTLDAESRAWIYLSMILNFSTLAAMATGILIVSGGYLAWQHVGNWSAAFSTTYGQTLLVKVGLALVAFVFAGINLIYIKPRLNKGYDTPEDPQNQIVQKRLRQIVRLEAVVTILILVAAGYLTDLQRGKDAPLISDTAGLLELSGQADDLTIDVTVEPAVVGENTFRVAVTDADGDPLVDAELVRLRFTFLGQSIGSATTDLLTEGDGIYFANTSNLSLVGPWQLEVVVRRTGEFDAFVPFRLEAVLGGRIVGQSAGARDRVSELATTLTRTGGLVPGVALVLFAIFWGLIANKSAHRPWQLIPLFALSFITFWIGGQYLFAFYNDYTPSMFANNPFIPDSSSVAKGQVVYTENCVTCHGEKGLGDGPTAATIYPPPVDFTSGHTETHPDGDLYYWIKEGVEGTAMPAFGDKLTDEEVWHTINYIRRLNAGLAD